MAWVAIPNNPHWEYNDAPAEPSVGSPHRALWLEQTNGIRTFGSGAAAHEVYVNVRRVGDTADTSKGELSKSFWDAKGDEDDLQPFTMTVRTTAANEIFTIPCRDVGTFNASVDWGDGSTSAITAYNDANLVHTYTSAGDHAISISGTFPNIYFDWTGEDRSKVIAVTNLGQVGWQTFESAFSGCDYMTSFTSGACDTSSITDMSNMFRNCQRLTTADLSTLNTSSVTSFYRMFDVARLLVSLDLSNWDTSSGIDFSYMFSNMPTLTSLDVSSFDTSNATNMSYMFYGVFRLASLDVSNFDTSNVTNMISMFDTMFFLSSLDVSNFDTSNVTNMSAMFRTMFYLTSLDLSNFDTSNVTRMDDMFSSCGRLSSLDISSFRTPNLIGSIAMFSSTNSLAVIDVSNFDTSNVTSFGRMFSLASNNNRSDIIGLENFNFEAINQWNSLESFMTNMALPTSRYDQFLINIDAQTITQTLQADFGSSEYTAGGAAEAARANIISTDGWTITDGGAA